jgi:DNA-binding NtrC family response regulator
MVDEASAELKRSMVLEAIRLEDGNRSRAARRLGYKHPSDFFRLLRSLDLRLPRGRTGRPKAAMP